MRKLSVLFAALIIAATAQSQNADRYGRVVMQALGSEFTLEKVLSDTPDKYQVLASCEYMSEYSIKSLVQRRVIDRYGDVEVIMPWTREHSDNGDFIVTMLITDDLEYLIAVSYMHGTPRGYLQVLVSMRDERQQ